MFLEAEVYWLLIVFFAIIIMLNCALLVWCYFRSHNKAIVWFGGQALFLILAFYYFYQCITNLPDPTFAMYSEEQSMTLAHAGMFWALSVILELVGICKIIKTKDEK